MSDAKPDQEPSMEEILASIRRIISEDEAEESTEDAPPTIENDDEPLIAEAAAPEPADEDVFELTQEVQDDGTVVDLATGETLHTPDPPELVEVEDFDEPEPEPAVQEALPANIPFFDGQGLVGPPATAASTASFETLAHTVAGKRAEASIGGKTVEEVVKEVVRPIIKDWLDENLPSLVERLVSREIARMTRQAEDAADR